MVETIAPAQVAHLKLANSGPDEVNYFGMTGADLKAEAESGDTFAAAEIARRKNNRAAKVAARRAAAA